MAHVSQNNKHSCPRWQACFVLHCGMYTSKTKTYLISGPNQFMPDDFLLGWWELWWGQEGGFPSFSVCFSPLEKLFFLPALDCCINSSSILQKSTRVTPHPEHRAVIESPAQTNTSVCPVPLSIPFSSHQCVILFFNHYSHLNQLMEPIFEETSGNSWAGHMSQ